MSVFIDVTFVLNSLMSERIVLHGVWIICYLYENVHGIDRGLDFCMYA